MIDWSATAGTSAWAGGSNWLGGTAPTSDLTTHIARFNQATYTSQPNYGTTSIAGIIVGNGTTALGNLTLSGTALTIGSSGIEIKAASGTVALNNAVKLGASQTWTNNSSSLFAVGGARAWKFLAQGAKFPRNKIPTASSSLATFAALRLCGEIILGYPAAPRMANLWPTAAMAAGRQFL